MRTRQQMLDEIEDRSMGWTWDTRIPALLTALSTFSDLPREIKLQEDILNSILARADLYGVLRTSLNCLTSNETSIRVSGPASGLSVEDLSVPRPEPHPRAGDAALDRLVTELCRLEKEFTATRLDYPAILRFLRNAK